MGDFQFFFNPLLTKGSSLKRGSRRSKLFPCNSIRVQERQNIFDTVTILGNVSINIKGRPPSPETNFPSHYKTVKERVGNLYLKFAKSGQSLLLDSEKKAHLPFV